MATNVKVVSTDLRQATIKVNPGTYLTDVLEQACKKFGLSQDNYLLKHNKRTLDLSNTFRNAGLVQGARLELVAKSKSPSVLSIALQLPDAEGNTYGAPRATEKLPSDYSLWKVLRHFESETFRGKNINLTGRGVPQMESGGQGQLYYETPVLLLERRSFSTLVDFQKTLAQLGYNSGTVLIRLSFQRTDKTLMDAMRDITEYFQEEEIERQARPEEPSNSNVAESTAAATAPAAVEQQEPSKAEPSEPSDVLPDAPARVEETTKAEPQEMDVDLPSTDPLVPVSVFSAPTSATPAAASVFESDDAYVPSIANAQLHQQRLTKEGQNKRLLSDQELEEKAAAEAAKLEAVKAVDIKVRFHDNTSAQWRFGPEAQGNTLYTAVRSVMASEATTAPFRLVLPHHGTQGIITIRDDAASLIKGYGLTVKTLVNLVWEDAAPSSVRSAPFLKSSVASQAQRVVVPEIPEVEVEDGPGPSAPRPAPREEPRGEAGGLKKLPKWLKGLGGKK